MKRYDIHTEIVGDGWFQLQDESPTGQWCKWEDVKAIDALADKLEARIAELNAERHELTMYNGDIGTRHFEALERIAELEAEVAKLKRACDCRAEERNKLFDEVVELKQINSQLASDAICPEHLQPENVRSQTAQECYDMAIEHRFCSAAFVADMIKRRYGI